MKNEDHDSMALDSPEPEASSASREVTPTPTAKGLGKRPERLVLSEPMKPIESDGYATYEARGRSKNATGGTAMARSSTLKRM